MPLSIINGHLFIIYGAPEVPIMTALGAYNSTSKHRSIDGTIHTQKHQSINGTIHTLAHINLEYDTDRKGS